LNNTAKQQVQEEIKKHKLLLRNLGYYFYRKTSKIEGILTPLFIE
jgi:hypothetical protein